jgi:uncharacterized membrane protein YhaH (DUF805 family)
MPLPKTSILRNYLSTEGRIGRCDYWLRITALTFLTTLVSAVVLIIWDMHPNNIDTRILIMLGFYALWLVIAGYSWPAQT